MALREADMDVVGGLFALRVNPETNLVELYIEDDEWFHFKAQFNEVWLNDLAHIAIAMDSLLKGHGIVINNNLKL